MDAFVWRPVDFIFDFGTTAGVVGQTYQIGQGTSFWRADNNQGVSAFTLDAESIAEVSGMEIFGPYVGNRRVKLGYVTLTVNGVEMQNIKMNELMAPGKTDGLNGGMNENGLRFGQAMVNFGMPLLAGGMPEEATPKIGPSEYMNVKVYFPQAAEGGDAAITTPMIVRLWIAQAKGVDKLNHLLDYYHGSGPGASGRFSGGRLDCGFDVGDLELGVVDHFPRTVGGESGGKFDTGDWTSIHGGSDANKPKVYNQIAYSQNNAATTTNTWYQPTQDNNRVLYDWQNMTWNFTKKDALKITHLGVLPHKNLRYLRMYRSNRAMEYIQEVQIARNPLQLPCGMYTHGIVNVGMAKLPKSFMIYGEKAEVDWMDNGVSIPAWTATTRGTMTAYYGKRYELG